MLNIVYLTQFPEKICVLIIGKLFTHILDILSQYAYVLY